MDSIVITTLIGALSAGLSSIVTWLLSKRKYNSEVDNSNIKNMQDSLQFYVTLADDYKARLEEEIKNHNAIVAELKKENESVRRELREQELKFNDQLRAQQQEISLMKNQMISVYSQVCLKFNCLERKPVKKTAPKKDSSIDK
jgi:predicted RNase H-like nuclease (RuvC/YqgF family)